MRVLLSNLNTFLCRNKIGAITSAIVVVALIAAIFVSGKFATNTMTNPVDGTEVIAEESVDTPVAQVNAETLLEQQDIVLLDAIYYDQLARPFGYGGSKRWQNAEAWNQGEHTRAWVVANDVAVQPMVYGTFGAVDWNTTTEIPDKQKQAFVAWLDETIPVDYSGPLCLDLEGVLWSRLNSTNQAAMDKTLDIYIAYLNFAKSLRPDAKIGFWGFPKKTHTNPKFGTADVTRLIEVCTAIFPDVYEHNPNGRDAARLQRHIERAISMVDGNIPVYVQTSLRYKLDDRGNRHFHVRDEFIRDQVQSALDAVWIDDEGVEHRIAGIALWDLYRWIAEYTEGWQQMKMEERKALWEVVDNRHVEFFKAMQSAIEATNQRLKSRPGQQ